MPIKKKPAIEPTQGLDGEAPPDNVEYHVDDENGEPLDPLLNYGKELGGTVKQVSAEPPNWELIPNIHDMVEDVLIVLRAPKPDPAVPPVAAVSKVIVSNLELTMAVRDGFTGVMVENTLDHLKAVIDWLKAPGGDEIEYEAPFYDPCDYNRVQLYGDIPVNIQDRNGDKLMAWINLLMFNENTNPADACNLLFALAQWQQSLHEEHGGGQIIRPFKAPNQQQSQQDGGGSNFDRSQHTDRGPIGRGRVGGPPGQGSGAEQRFFGGYDYTGMWVEDDPSGIKLFYPRHKHMMADSKAVYIVAPVVGSVNNVGVNPSNLILLPISKIYHTEKPIETGERAGEIAEIFELSLAIPPRFDKPVVFKVYADSEKNKEMADALLAKNIPMNRYITGEFWMVANTFMRKSEKNGKDYLNAWPLQIQFDSHWLKPVPVEDTDLGVTEE